MKRKLNLMDVKQALLDSRFRDSLPESVLGDVQKFLSNPGCGCNHPIYKRIMKECAKQLSEYFPTRETMRPEEVDAVKEPQGEWTVINCSITELQDRLRKLPHGRHTIEVARFQDQVTVVIFTDLEG